MYVNNAEMTVLDINEIRKLVNGPSPSAPRIESECRKALMLQHGSTDTERAELLFWYAGAVGSNQLRQLEAAPYAARAAHLAKEASHSNFTLVVQARSLYISLVATTLTREKFQLHADNLRHSINMFTPKLSDEQRAQIQQCLNQLDRQFRNYTQSRLFTDM